MTQQGERRVSRRLLWQAAGPIRTYINLLHDRVERENIHVAIWAATDSPHLNDDLLAKANDLWQQAESSWPASRQCSSA